MGLNVSKGNMYPWVTHTFNTIKGKCPHDCSYCYMKRKGYDLKVTRLDTKEFKTDLGEGNVVFVGSSCDIFANNIPYVWLTKTIEYLKLFNNKYLFQSKNPKGFDALPLHDLDNFILCTTIETNRVYPEIMGFAPEPIERALHFGNIPIEEKYITIEPIMDFDIRSLVEMIRYCRPLQVNIGADSKGHNLPEPDPGKLRELIDELDIFTEVEVKKNLNRIF